MAVERSLILIKPDAVERKLAGEILARIERRGFRLRAGKLVRERTESATQHNADAWPEFGFCQNKFGGALGVFLGVLLAKVVSWVSPLPSAVQLWSVLGGLLVVLRLGLFSYWMNSYWGGAPAAIGGALVLGALPRMMKRLRLRYTVLMGLGAAILAASRPYEGGALCRACARGGGWPDLARHCTESIF